MSDAASRLSRTYLLSDTACHLEVFRLDDGSIAAHAPALLTAAEAEQLANGLLAVLSNQFDFAISESTLRWDLSRRTRTAPASPPSAPELDSL